jgi:hypothetical protein
MAGKASRCVSAVGNDWIFVDAVDENSEPPTSSVQLRVLCGKRVLFGPRLPLRLRVLCVLGLPLSVIGKKLLMTVDLAVTHSTNK